VPLARIFRFLYSTIRAPPEPMSGRPHLLHELTWRDVRGASFEIAVLPWGATEAHNFHLPYGTDTIQASEVAAAAAERAACDGAGVIVLPAIPFGVQTGQLDVPLCINLNPSTQAAILADITRSLELAGVTKLVILNGHGGNDFRALVRELQPRTEVFLCVVDWWKVADGETYFDEPGDHAGELETSCMLHLAADLVRPLEEAGNGDERCFRVTGLREGWAWAPRVWTRISDDTGVGDPRAATAERGAAFLEEVTARLSRFLVELARTGVDDLYDG
jgi:creatinine amidohydrolase